MGGLFCSPSFFMKTILNPARLFVQRKLNANLALKIAVESQWLLKEFHLIFKSYSS